MKSLHFRKIKRETFAGIWEMNERAFEPMVSIIPLGNQFIAGQLCAREMHVERDFKTRPQFVWGPTRCVCNGNETDLMWFNSMCVQ